MKKSKKLLSVFLSLVMALSVCTGISVPATAATEGVLTYEINDGEATITDCIESTSGELVIPDTLGGCPLTRIGDRAFEDCGSLTSIIIPDGVTSIGKETFYKCTSLTSITIPDSVTSIGVGAFFYCTNLTSITIPDSVTSIGASAFSGCSRLTSIIIPDSVTSIGRSVFSYCRSLTSITIPDSVTSIGDWAFVDCTGLTSITIPESVNSIGSRAFYGTGYYNDESNWEDGVLYIGNHCISAKGTISGNYTIKDGTICIAGGAFSGCTSLTSITIPDSVTSIGSSAFYDCYSLTSITIPDSVTGIGDEAFSGCSSLTSITIPDGVTSIGSSAFYGTGYYYDESNWEDSVLYIGNHCIRAKDTISGSYTIKDGIICIADYAFYGRTSLTSITIPDSVTSIGGRAIGYFFNNSTYSYETIEGFIIYGTPGTAAETYANENGITFVAVEEEPSTEEPSTEEPTSEYPGLEEPTSGEPILEEPSTDEPTTVEPTTVEPTTEEPTTAEATTEEPTTTAPTTKAPETPTKTPATTATTTTTEPTTKASDELIVKDTDCGITVMKDEPIASIEAVDNKGLTAEAIKAKLGNEVILIVNEDGEELAADALVGTGCVIQVRGENGEVLSSYTVLVPMDVNGDAAITAQDARAALRAAAHLTVLEGVFSQAADSDGDTKLTASDARRILRKAAHLE